MLVRRADSETMSKGGLFLPEVAQEKQEFGIVQAVGDGKVLPDGTVRSMLVKVGDKVLLSKWGGVGGNEVTIAGELFLMVNETDLLAILTD